MTTKELAKTLNVTEVTIWRWRKEGMPFLTLKHSIRFEYEKVMKWLQEQSNRKGAQ